MAPVTHAMDVAKTRDGSAWIGVDPSLYFDWLQ
jgi:hypothetical protein